MQNMIEINIKYGRNGESLALQLSSECTIEEIKRRVVSQINRVRKTEASLNPEDIAIIFAGKELNDSLQIKHCDLGNNSVIHAVKIKHKSSTKDANASTTLSEAVVNLSFVDEKSDLKIGRKTNDNHLLTSAERKSFFFVYCSCCKNIDSGKLRVRCAKCKEDTLTVDKDPTCWEDVLTAGKINGTCHNGFCDGSVAEFYFKCASKNHPPLESNTSVVVLYLIRYNNREVTCLACADVNDIVVVFPCSHKHVICINCFKIYCLSKLNDRQFIIDSNIGYTLSCAVGCENSLIKETHHFRIMGEEAYKKYQRFAAEECLLQSDGVICPQPNCGAGIFVEFDDDIDPDLCNRVVCSACNYVFCRTCMQGYHIGNCESNEILSLDITSPSFSQTIDSKSANNSKWENELSLKTIKGTTKPCPKCRTPVERDGGCMHMRCTRSGCGFNWCWICQSEWTRNCMADHWFN
ncbi:E3 ubiquitin-protein ligase parkin-like protein [Dinothrombium tinctorium]|uniref:E3 ubiquitin-protein ligase parkin n=1 Tax=Dinothrombium tinctorium TaxID=1965070 RepID=A0A3S3QWE6_9ACAR|nr:E3 ubiquitin-protein ligase parkin-like protein [Dinothrombium tinctorium]RWS15064.1 E3 ubiquitin-protein ligase parkin-like protein [Dinothrombium tinctorium]